jgi:hypothetical protein
MMAFFAICDALGGVRGAGSCAAETLGYQVPLIPGGSIAVVGAGTHDAILANIGGYRLLNGVVVARDAMALAVSSTTITADGVDEATITGLPDPCSVTISGAVSWGPGDVTGGSLTLTATTPGAINVTVASEPQYSSETVVIHAT